MGVLTNAEEQLLLDWMLKMANLGYPINMGESKAKVFELTQTRPTPFFDVVPAIEPNDDEDDPMDSADLLLEEVVGDQIPNWAMA